MSASLVGSEMCIRDRILRLRQGMVAPRFLADDWMAQAAGPQHEQAIRPVSYTHLTLPTICSV
eukprot:14788661-Alexandrium_andersonii.AAC.1